MSSGAGAVYTRAGSAAALNGGCVPHSSGPSAVASHARLPVPGLPTQTRLGGLLPHPWGWWGGLGGAGSAAPHPVLMRSCHWAWPRGPATRPVAGAEGLAALPARKLLPHAGGRSCSGRGHLSPLPPCGDPVFTGLGLPQRCSSEHWCRPAQPRDPVRSGGLQGCSRSCIAPGAALALGHGSPTARPDSPSRRQQGLLLQAVPAPTAPEGFNSSDSGFHNPAEPPQAARTRGDLGGSLLKPGQAESCGLGG